MILTLSDYYQDQYCPELINSFDIEPYDDNIGFEDASFTSSVTLSYDPKDADNMDAQAYSLYLAYGDQV